MLAAAKAVRQHVATMLDGMIHDFERATGSWHLEWVSVPESFLLTASALANAKFMLAGLVVHERRVRENLDLTHGLIVAEAVMMAAAPKSHRRVLNGEQVPSAEKLYSIFEPHTDLIKRGKVQTPIEFGHKVFLAESARGLITQYDVLDGNPVDEQHVVVSLERTPNCMDRIAASSVRRM